MAQKRGKSRGTSKTSSKRSSSDSKSARRKAVSKKLQKGFNKRGRASPKKKSHVKRVLAGKAKTKKASKKKQVSHPKKQIKKHVHRKKEMPPVMLEEKVQRPPHEMSEEFFVPSPIHRGKYSIPMGIRFLIGYLIFLAILYCVTFISGITFPTTILFGKLVVGTRAMFINAVLFAIILLMIMGFWKRKPYAFDLSISFFSFSALNAFISLMIFESAEHPVFRQLILLSFISLVLMNIVVVWYILHEKRYFYVERFKERPWHRRDKIFLFTLITFWVVALIIGATLGARFYQNTKDLIDDTISELKQGNLDCQEKAGPEKDVCNLVIATTLSQHGKTRDELTRYCDRIASDFYRFTCEKSISGNGRST